MDSPASTSRQITFVNKEIYDNIRMGEVQKRWVTYHRWQADAHVGDPQAPDFDPQRNTPRCSTARAARRAPSPTAGATAGIFSHGGQGYMLWWHRTVADAPRSAASGAQQISSDYSGTEHQDYLAAIDDVAREPWCDTDHGMRRRPRTADIRSTTSPATTRAASRPHLALRNIRLRVDVRPDRGLLHQPRLRRPLGQRRTPRPCARMRIRHTTSSTSGTRPS